MRLYQRRGGVPAWFAGCCCFVFAACGAVAAESAPMQSRRITTTLVSDADGVGAREAFRPGLRLRIALGWRVCLQNPGDAGVPPDRLAHPVPPAGGSGDDVGLLGRCDAADARHRDRRPGARRGECAGVREDLRAERGVAYPGARWPLRPVRAGAAVCVGRRADAPAVTVRCARGGGWNPNARGSGSVRRDRARRVVHPRRCRRDRQSGPAAR